MTESSRRLLDMLAGWGFYVEELTELHEGEDELADLYQEAGGIKFQTDEEVWEFVERRVKPFLLKGPDAVE